MMLDTIVVAFERLDLPSRRAVSEFGCAALRQQARDPRVPSGTLKKMGPYCAVWDPRAR